MPLVLQLIKGPNFRRLFAADLLPSNHVHRVLQAYSCATEYVLTRIPMLRRAKMDHSGRATVLLEFPATTGNSVILAALVAQQPTGVAAVPATFFNAEVRPLHRPCARVTTWNSGTAVSCASSVLWWR